MNPKISVLIPIYNGGKYLKEALNSVLLQTFGDFEIIAVDDGSIDNSLEILKSFSDPRLRIITNDANKGLIASLNIGLAATRGTYVARFDQDDICMPERFKKQLEFLEKNPSIVLCGTWSNIINSEGKYMTIHRNPTRNNVIKYELLFGNTVTHPSIMMRRDIVLLEGGYDPNWVHTEDYNLYSRLIQKYVLANIPEPLINYRTHGTSITGTSSSQSIVKQNTYRMMRRNISQYLPINDEDMVLITDVITLRDPNPLLSLKVLMRAYALHKKIWKAFVAKESDTLDRNDIREIQDRYTSRRNLMFNKFLVGKYQAFTGKK